jgi:lipid kinase YegS
LKKPAKTCLVLHKKSCTRPEVKAAVKHVRRSGIDIDVYIPWSRKDLRRFVRQALKDGALRIVAGGGDGTLNALVNAMIRRDKRPKASLGILPLGTANDFARGAGINANDLKSALELACTGSPTKIDVGRANEQYFINVASAGFGAEVTATTPPDMKRLLGGMAYSIMGFVKAFQLEPYEGRLILPDGTVKEGSMLIMAVGNSRFAGGGYEVAPQASLTDGLLDIAVVSGLLSEDLSHIVGELSDPMNPRNEHLLYRQLSAFTIETGKPLNVNLDGESTKGSHFEFQCVPEALSVVLGGAAASAI